ncbi:MAG TPA: hypothetical protein VIV66_16345 [Pyrinomonadaceae bacterium]
MKISRIIVFFLSSVFVVAAFRVQGQTNLSPVAPEFLSALQWRCIGPHRGGRVLAVSGVRGEPNTFYFGAVGGGVWKTIDAGRTWTPIFDDQPVASIGALAVSQSDPNIIFVGTGEADMRSDISFGAGIYKSTDAGKSWNFLGLADTRQIGRILIDPKNPQLVLVAALGHGFGPNQERGVFRSSDGGASWAKVLYKGENTGAIDLAFDPDNTRTVYASLWNARRPPWSTYAPITGPGGGLYKSTDAGESWKELTGGGLPSGNVGRIGIDVARGQHGRRVFALIDAVREGGLYRSDDAGATWTRVSTEPRILSRGWYFGEVRIDPKNPDLVYVSNVSLYRSGDGGKSFIAIRGAPGGDDYHSLWIDPDNPQRMISGVDQGTLVTVNGGQTWSSWYNQPTAQFYHVAVDNQFPYWVYGAQQDSGTAAVVSRSDYGLITFRDWHPIGAGESGYILPDPANPDIVYGGSTGGELYRWDRKTGQVQDVTPTLAQVGVEVRQRYPWTTPIAFSARPPYTLYQASQFLYATKDGGNHWQRLSGDLTIQPGVKESDAKAVIYTIAPSRTEPNTVWIGTDNGLIKLTRDGGKTWRDVSIEGLAAWSTVSMIDPSPIDTGSAYAAIDRHQSDDVAPYIYRTRDFGKTWVKITNGLPANAYVHAVREDSIRKELLFAATEMGVFVSFDDGTQWQSLQINMPISPVRDLVIKDNDLVIATHGRSFWILDDISPLREINSITSSEDAHLFKPATGIRLRKNESRDTPLPPETPAGKNPPAGAIIYYSLKSTPSRDITLEILDSSGEPVQRVSSSDPPAKAGDLQSFPDYWLKPSTPLTKNAGLNRFVWNLRYDRPRALRYGYSIAAAFGEDAILEPEGPLAIPGRYQVRLLVNGKSYTSPLELKMDPRVKFTAAALAQQLALQKQIVAALRESSTMIAELQNTRRQLASIRGDTGNNSSQAQITDAVQSLDKTIAGLLGGPPQFPAPLEATASSLNNALASLLNSVDGADAPPTAAADAAYLAYRRILDQQKGKWSAVKAKQLADLNTLLRARGVREIRLAIE